MAITNESSNGFYMPVAPASVGYGGNAGGFGFGGDWSWILLLILLCGGWGNGFGGGFGGFGADGLYPWMNNSQNINSGFRDQMLQTSIASVGDKITSGFGDVATQLCGGFAGVNASINGAQNAIAQQMYTNQIADLQQSFALQSQLAQCCCDNRAATADLKYTVATEECATRNAATANTQMILDKLCQLELDGYKRENDQLRSQLQFANMQASQTAQTAQILAGQSADIDGVYNRLKNCPVPSMPVYGNTPIFSCNGNPSCGCGCGA